MPLEIPGYYFDSEKNKYFKIERSATAPRGAQWSADSVKRQRLQQAESPRRPRIRRDPLRQDAVAQGALVRETDGHGWEAEHRAAAWAGGLKEEKGVSFGTGRTHIPCFHVLSAGLAYATRDGTTLLGKYIDDKGEAGAEMVRCPQMSGVNYHAASHRMLVTSRDPSENCGLFMFSPPRERGRWLIGGAEHYQRIAIRPRSQPQRMIHGCAVPEPGGGMVCVAGTNEGVLGVHSNGSTSVVLPPQVRGLRTGDMFAQEFQRNAGDAVVLAGGRAARLWVVDRRAREEEWERFSTRSSVTHVRGVNEHQVLVAGLRDSMALYDLRFSGGNARRPLVTFGGYKNQAHVHAGFDLSRDLGVAAAAQDDGVVRLFCVRSGGCLGMLGGVDGGDAPFRGVQFCDGRLWVGDGGVLRRFAF